MYPCFWPHLHNLYIHSLAYILFSPLIQYFCIHAFVSFDWPRTYPEPPTQLEKHPLIPTKAEGRREAYQGFSNASPDSAVMTHVWKRDVIGAPILRLPRPTHIFDFNRLNRHVQQERSDRQPQTEQRGPIQTSPWDMHHLHWPCHWHSPCKTARAKPGTTSPTPWTSVTNPRSPAHINRSTRLEHDWQWRRVPLSPTCPVFGSSSTASCPRCLQSCRPQPRGPSRMYDLSWAILRNAYERHWVWQMLAQSLHAFIHAPLPIYAFLFNVPFHMWLNIYSILKNTGRTPTWTWHPSLLQGPSLGPHGLL